MKNTYTIFIEYSLYYESPESYFGKQVLVGSCFIVLLLSNIFNDLRSLKSPEKYDEKLSNHATKWGGLMCQKITSNYILKNPKDWLKNCEKPAEPQVGYVPSTMSSARWRLLPACEEADGTHDASEMKILCNSSHLRHPSIGIMYIVFMVINSVIKQYGDGYGIPHETTRASVSATPPMLFWCFVKSDAGRTGPGGAGGGFMVSSSRQDVRLWLVNKSGSDSDVQLFSLNHKHLRVMAGTFERNA